MTTPTMIEPTQDIVPVTAADREAYLAMNMLPESDAIDVRAGRWDHTTGMQVLARHRLAHTAPAAQPATGELVEALEDARRNLTNALASAMGIPNEVASVMPCVAQIDAALAKFGGA